MLYSTAVNVREGMRRFGIVASIVGALVGCVIAYAHGQDVYARRNEHARFVKLISGSTIQREVEAYQGVLAAESFQDDKADNKYQDILGNEIDPSRRSSPRASRQVGRSEDRPRAGPSAGVRYRPTRL